MEGAWGDQVSVSDGGPCHDGLVFSEAVWRCTDCGAERIAPGMPSDVPPCPVPGCESTAITIEVAIHDGIAVHDGIRGRVKDHTFPSKKRIPVEFVSGAEYYRKDSRWHRVERLIDHKRNWYAEDVYDAETGELVHRCHEPLTEHQGHGRARRSISAK